MILDEVVFDALGHAAYHANDEFAPFFAQSVQCFEAMENLLLRIVTYRTGVEQYQVGLVNAFADVVACDLEYRAYHFAVGQVHLAAICLYEEFLVVFHFGLSLGIGCEYSDKK